MKITRWEGNLPSSPCYYGKIMSNDLVDRLKGIYRIPITDGLGPVAGSEEPTNSDYFVRTFETSPICKEAAHFIENQEQYIKHLENVINDNDEFIEELNAKILYLEGIVEKII